MQTAKTTIRLAVLAALFLILISSVSIAQPGAAPAPHIDHSQVGPEQTQNISGQVVFETGAPLAGVTLWLWDGTQWVTSTVTDANGNYWFLGLTPGFYQVWPYLPEQWDADYTVWPKSRDAITFDGEVSGQWFVVFSRWGDIDGDALPNGWEIDGYDHDRDNVADVDLPAMGASPARKDLFVEVDYMRELCGPQGLLSLQSALSPEGGCTTHTHKPKAEALKKVIESFTQAPVSNPDGSTGISIHIDSGSDSVMDPLTGATWGSLSQSNSLPHQEHLDNEDRRKGFYNIKNVQGNMKDARKRIFHYALFVHRMAPDDRGSSGVSLHPSGGGIPGPDFIVSLGGWNNDPGYEGTVIEQAGTFLHELGHNLGLRHGGDDHEHRKPNYFSVMNYSFQLNGMIRDGQDGFLDYARFPEAIDLDENALDESNGLPGIPAGYGTRYYCGGAEQRIVDVANIDWDCDQVVEDGLQSGDINNDGNQTVLDGNRDDWSTLVMHGGNTLGASSGGVGAQSVQQEEVEDEVTNQDANEILVPYEIYIGGGGEYLSSAGTIGLIPFTIVNLGELEATITITTTSWNEWFDFSAVPEEATLAASVSELTYPVTVTVPFDAEWGDFDLGYTEVTVNEAPNMGDIAIMTIEVRDLVADFAAFPTVVQPFDEVQFVDFSVGETTSWFWQFGDGNISWDENPTHVYEESGVYSVTLTISNAAGEDTKTETELILVDENLGLFADFDATEVHGPAPLTTQFIDFSYGEVETWLWEFGDGETSTEPFPEHTYTSPGFYDVTLTVTGPNDTSDVWTIPDFIHVTEGISVFLPMIRQE